MNGTKETVLADLLDILSSNFLVKFKSWKHSCL